MSWPRNGTRSRDDARIHNPLWRAYALHKDHAIEEMTTWQKLGLLAALKLSLEHDLQKERDATESGVFPGPAH